MLLLEIYFQNCYACFGRSECKWVNQGGMFVGVVCKCQVGSCDPRGLHTLRCSFSYFLALEIKLSPITKTGFSITIRTGPLWEVLNPDDPSMAELAKMTQIFWKYHGGRNNFKNMSALLNLSTNNTFLFKWFVYPYNYFEAITGHHWFQMGHMYHIAPIGCLGPSTAAGWLGRYINGRRCGWLSMVRL